MKNGTLLPDAGEVVLDQLMVEGGCRLVMLLRAAGEAGGCPECGQESRRIHSRYRRRLSDLPWEGIPVRIDLRVRGFFCDRVDCGQQIFTERLPKTVQRYSRRTCRLSASLQQITSVLGGSAGSRLAKQLGILASGSTLLRQLRRKLIKPSAQGPRVLGIDDWAWRKGHRYGTILCDLERGKVVDLLPDRSAESTAEWLRAHPGTEIVSRDRASLYAQGGKQSCAPSRTSCRSLVPASQLDGGIHRCTRTAPSNVVRHCTGFGNESGGVFRSSSCGGGQACPSKPG